MSAKEEYGRCFAWAIPGRQVWCHFIRKCPIIGQGDRLYAASGRYRSLTNYTFMQGTGAWQPDIGEAAVFQ